MSQRWIERGKYFQNPSLEEGLEAENEKRFRNGVGLMGCKKGRKKGLRIPNTGISASRTYSQMVIMLICM